jgi:hypothetical protein
MTNRYECRDAEQPDKSISVDLKAKLSSKTVLAFIALISSIIGGSASSIPQWFSRSQPQVQTTDLPAECKYENEKLRDRIDALERAIAISIARSDILVEYLPAPIKKKTVIRKE